MKFFFSLGLICFALSLVAQSDSSGWRERSSIEFGLHRTWRQKPVYINPPTIKESDLSSPGAWGYTFYPTTAFHINGFYDFYSYKYFSLRTGISLNQWRLVYKVDSLVRFNSLLTYYGDTSTVFTSYSFTNTKLEYRGSFYDVSIPLYIGYSRNKMSIYGGISLSVISYEYAWAKPIDGAEGRIKEFRWESSVTKGKIYLTTSWELSLYYLMTIKKNDFYLSATLYMDGYVGLGINIPLN